MKIVTLAAAAIAGTLIALATPGANAMPRAAAPAAAAGVVETAPAVSPVHYRRYRHSHRRIRRHRRPRFGIYVGPRVRVHRSRRAHVHRHCHRRRCHTHRHTRRHHR